MLRPRRLREVYLRVSSKIRRGSPNASVILSGGNVEAERRALWRRALVETGRLRAGPSLRIPERHSSAARFKQKRLLDPALARLALLAPDLRLAGIERFRITSSRPRGANGAGARLRPGKGLGEGSRAMERCRTAGHAAGTLPE